MAQIKIVNRTFSTIRLKWNALDGQEKELEFECKKRDNETRKITYHPVMVEESDLEDFLAKKPQFKAYFEPRELEDGEMQPMLDAPDYKLNKTKKSA